MKNLKRALSFALATVMLIGMMVVGASAASFNDAKNIEKTDAVNMLVALGIVNGKDTGDFDPTGSVTRGEIAKMIYVVKAGKDNKLSGVGLFKDTVGHWAAGYIDYCANQGIVSGDTAGNFNPNAPVTGTQAAKMLLTVLGYNAETEGFVNNAGWSLNIDTLAYENGLYEDVDGVPSEALDRENAAQMIFNALNAEKVKYELVGIVNGNGVSQAVGKNETIMETTFKVKAEDGKMTAISYDADEKEYTYTIGGEKYVSANDYSELFGMTVVAQCKDGDNEKVYGIYAEEGTIVATGIVDDISKTSEGKLKINGTEYKYDSKVTDLKNVAAYAFNGTEGTLADAEAYFEMKAIDDNGDDKIDFIVYAPFTFGQITFVGRDTFKIDKGASIDLDAKDYVLYDDMAKNDFVKITTDLEGNTVLEKLETVSGKVSGKNSSGDVKIDGTWYALNDFELTTGKTYKTMPVANGFILKSADVKGGAEAKVDEYAYVVEMEKSIGFGVENYRANLLLTTGEKITVELAEDYDTYKAFEGTLVIFDIDEDGLYELEAATDEAFDGATATGDKFADGKIDGMSVADDAVIFIKGDNGKVKVVTGAELKKADDDKITTVTCAYYNEASNGFESVALAYVTGSIKTTSDALYGYVISGVSEEEGDEADEILYTVKVWDGTKEITLTSENKINLKKGNMITYKLNEDDMIAKNSIAAVSATKAAVKAYDGENIKFDNGSTVYEITEDTEIIFINSEDKKAAAAGTIELAFENEETENENDYIANVYYIAEDGEIVLLVVDDANEMANFVALP